MVNNMLNVQLPALVLLLQILSSLQAGFTQIIWIPGYTLEKQWTPPPCCPCIHLDCFPLQSEFHQCLESMSEITNHSSLPFTEVMALLQMLIGVLCICYWEKFNYPIVFQHLKCNQTFQIYHLLQFVLSIIPSFHRKLKLKEMPHLMDFAKLCLRGNGSLVQVIFSLVDDCF